MNFFRKQHTDLAALILRVGFGFFMAMGHGWGKLNSLLSGNFQFPGLFGLPSGVNLALAVFGEFVCSLLIILGLKTRWAAIPAMFTMGTAALWVHLSDPLFMASAKGGGSKEFALLYLIGFVGIFFLGSGKYSIDALFKK